ncbi:uncharacterized protein LOC111073048 isoform X2 [Drosophila obscura]|uniref:uncharacterized protein LOC111073048 isoform X2 n=1 Tax=Drosophila obscura TaxID=7282 RepID=UPI001BB114A7|nr:uncharacterized protein LOC111073048 isoform X2 [Drosophila obscura]
MPSTTVPLRLCQPILNGFRNAPTLTDLSLREITAWETAAIAKIASLKRLTCGFYDESNAELLAELPELEELTIMSAQSYSYPQPLQRLQGLLAALASKEPQTLQKLCLERRINAVEAKELARLRSLRTLECDFFNHLDIQLLSQLTELEYLNLNSVKELDNILPGVLAVTDSCTKLTRIEIGCALKLSPRANLESGEILVKILEACQDKIDLLIGKGRISFNRKTNKLYLDMDFFGHKRLAIESLARLESVTHMDLEKRSGGSLRELLAALAMRYNSNLQSLNIPHQCLDFGDTMELARIPSLNNFRGRIHEESLRHLLHLSNFQVLKVLRHNSRFIPYEITFDQSTGKLTVSPLNVYLGDDLSNGIELNPLAGLQNLRKVFIAGVFEDGSMRDFLRQLAACQGETLQELRVDRRYEMSNEELREVSRMKSLRTLVCSVSHVQDIEIEQLAHLPHLAVLVVGSHRAGSLKNLLGSLAASKCPTLVHLAVRGAGLTPQEVTEVSAIGSLKGLECAFCSTEGLDVLSQRNCIEHLGITTREGETSLVDLLTAFASSGESNIQKLTIDGLAVGQELATAINLILRIPRLKSLKLPIKDTQGIERLAESLHLEDLTISCFPKRGSLAVLFRALSLKDSTKLNSLFIERTFIDFEEARNLVQVDSITRLKCGFRDYGSFSLLANMTNIENLEITFRPGHQYIYDNIIVECRYLKCIYVGNLSFFSYVYFIKYSLETLKSVRDPSTQGPLEIRTTGSYAKIYAMNSMTAIDIETYVIVTKWRDSDWNDSKDEPESVEERDKESESESDEERDKGTEEESESESDEESKEESYGKIIGIEIFRDVEESDEERDKESESESDEERDKGTEEESESESDEESDKGTEEESDEEIDEESEEESDGKIIGVIRDIKRRRIE